MSTLPRVAGTGDDAPRRVGVVGGAVAVAAYVALAWGGRALGEFDALSVWYAPAGLALAAGILFGWRAWPVVFLGELVGGIVVFGVGEFFTPLQLLVNAVAYATWYVLAALPLRRLQLGRPDPFGRCWWAVVVLLAPAAAAVTGVGVQRWAGMTGPGRYWPDVGLWWVGDAIGLVSIAPPLLVLAALTGVGRQRAVPQVLRTTRPAALALLLLLPAVVAVAITTLTAGNIGALAVGLVVVAPLAVRYGATGFALVTLALSPAVTIAANLVPTTPVQREDLQVLLLCLLAAGYLVGIVADEQRRASRRGQELAEVVEASSDLVATTGIDGRLRALNPAARRLAGLAPDADVEGLEEAALYADGVAGQLLHEARRHALVDGGWQGELVLRGTGGEQLPVSAVVLAHRGPEGEVTRTTAVMRDLSERRRLEADLRRKAVTDGLTGLVNRSLFLTQVELLRSRLVETGAEGFVLVLRLGRVEVVSRSLGAGSVDAVLREVAERLRAAGGSAVLAARLDGASFGLLPQAPLGRIQATQLATVLLQAVNRPIDVDGQMVPVSAMIGMAEVGPEEVSAADLVTAADIAAHRALRDRARIVCHEESMSADARRELALEQELRDAVATGSWALWYQPIATTDRLEVVGLEALLRVRPDTSPLPLLALAEQLGLIVPLGAAITDRAIGHAAVVADRGLEINVNASVRQLQDEGFTDVVADALQRHGVAASRVVVEVTESAALDGDGAVRRVLQALRDAGVRIALDDFGTGHSSLATLHDLPVDVIKLDRTFVQPLATSARMRALVGATLSMADALGIDVVAEGVEEPVQRDVLAELGCRRIQGYLVGRPAPVEAADAPSHG